ncbi:hypothetical protein [Acetobacter pasteurianus]|uniref:capsular polysaccharide export protein, LipB/KpsS family n=1 Tax=Acetobacter pasteurianus TaxID=438 RepID=UPI000B3ED3C7|nr:hypothetical protein [Acetobacter pasteurianus]
MLEKRQTIQISIYYLLIKRPPVIPLRKKEIENKKHFFLAPPPFKSTMPCIAEARPAASAISSISKETTEEIREAILTHKVGGTFWEKPLARCFRAILALPAQYEFSTAQKALHHLKQNFRQTDILLLVPELTCHTKKLAKKLHLSCAVAGKQDPHFLMETVQEVVAITPQTFQLDICLLAALHGKLVTLWNSQASSSKELSSSEALSIICHETCYFSPFTRQEVSCLHTVELLALWKRILLANREIGACMGMSLWKRHQIGAFLAMAPGKPRFFISPTQAIKACFASGKLKVAIWATRLPSGIQEALSHANIHLVLVEDGFIRSIGLGSALQPPASIFLDTRGIYYDPAETSDLEHILATYQFSESLLVRTHAVIERLRMRGISKYARASTTFTAFPSLKHQLKILVPGQVADDLSVLRGGGEIQDNLSLLKAVRKARPEAYIIYRPHPDVEGGYRKGALSDRDILSFADEINRDGTITEILNQIDEVHTLTSLAGFEALIRNIPVTTYGTPFYAGWGLTQDKGRIPARRHRTLSLTELVAGTLLVYPRYLDPVTHLPCTLETVLDRFEQPDVWRPTYWMRLRKVQITLHKTFSALCRNLTFSSVF